MRYILKKLTLILEQIRIVEFVPLTINCALNHDIFITNTALDNGIWDVIFTTNKTGGKAVKGLRGNEFKV